MLHEDAVNGLHGILIPSVFSKKSIPINTMKFLTVTELRLKATEIIREIEQTGDDVVITKKGKPVVLMQRVTDEVFTLKKPKEKQQLSFF